MRISDWSSDVCSSDLFTMRLTATASASYLKGRGDVGDSYRVGATGFYRLDRRWTIRAGVDYAKFPSAFSRGNGVSFNIGIVFQPDYRRRAEARYESRDNLSEISYNQDRKSTRLHSSH